MSPGALHLDRPVPAQLELGRGGVLVLSGHAGHGRSPIRALAVGLDDAYERIDDPLDSARPPAGRAFWAAVPISPARAGSEARISLRLEFRDGEISETLLGRTRFEAPARSPIVVRGPTQADAPLVVICLAAYRPEPQAFERQLASIRAQTHPNWVCIVNDDCSGPEHLLFMQRATAADTRFHLCRNERNHGFYGNFEQCLRRVPPQAQFIALADQDDYWYPDKIERLLRAFDDETRLVYSDMRIVGKDGGEISPTYWSNRRNEHERLDFLLLANTVTGAASMFRAELLELLLPFPPRIGDAFHDHWIACTALATGKIGYVDAPLYDYRQHGESVIGHCDFERATLRERARALARAARAVASPRSLKGRLLRVRNASLAVFQFECRRLEVIAATIMRRCEVRGRAERRALRLFEGGLASALKLLALHAKVLWRRHSTDDAELRLAMGYLVHWVDTLLLRRGRGEQERVRGADTA